MADRPTADAWRALPRALRSDWLRWLRRHAESNTGRNREGFTAMADALASLDPDDEFRDAVAFLRANCTMKRVPGKPPR